MFMELSSHAFSHGGEIPRKYTCDGDNVSPPLDLTGVPDHAKSLALLMEDPDIPDFVKKQNNIEVWDHWSVFNIPPETRSIPEAIGPKGVLGVNTGGRNAYGGPCPPDRRHRYFFRAYALDVRLKLPEGSTKQEILNALKGHVIEEAELIGTYER